LEQEKKREMIGGLLRFAPGRLGARQDRAPAWCEIRWWVVSSLPCGAPGDELGTRRRAKRAGRACLSRDGNRQRACGAVRQPWLAERLWGSAGRYRRWLVLGSGCATEGMAVPLAVKELRPLRGASGVLDREPPARHRQKGPAGKGACLRGRRAAL
jgi:hypothetical protein